MRYFNHRSRSHLHRTGSLFFLLFCVASWAGAQTAQIPSAEVEKRVDMLLAKMMLDDKIALLAVELINAFRARLRLSYCPSLR